jgi:hypothetical protein
LVNQSAFGDIDGGKCKSRHAYCVILALFPFTSIHSQCARNTQSIHTV